MLAFPADLGGLDAVTVAVSRLPLGGRLVEAAEARAMLAAGRLRPADVIEMVVSATVLASSGRAGTPRRSLPVR